VSVPTPQEPILDADEIQGDSLAGFRKDHVVLLFVRFEVARMSAARAWLAEFADHVAAYLGAVHAFNASYRRMRRTLAGPRMSATWTSIAFTFDGLRLLAPDADFTAIDPSFRAGAFANAGFAGDPTDGSPGDPRTWLVGKPDDPVHALITVAADSAPDADEVAELCSRSLPHAGITLVFSQRGDIRSGQPGHEHFGFKDGISQPGVRGRVGTDGLLVTPRLLDPKDPLSSDFASPGQPLLWPGEFVLGYPRKITGGNDPNGTTTDVVPAWMKNGSYLVFRRLRQDVPGFLGALESEAARIAALPGFNGMTPERLGALLVGRWRSGAPVMRTPLTDDAAIAADLQASNSFFYAHDTPAPLYAPSARHAADPTPRAMRDPTGITCPFSAHVRKVNPRDETTDQGAAARTLEHRILRRGLPYGPDYDPGDAASREADRGLLFLCYQSSIARGFEFLSHTWANMRDAPHDQAGRDMIIGTDTGADSGLVLKAAAPPPCQVTMPRFVTATGGLYLFAPSRQGIKSVLAREPGL
jgi:Dyp-type peroxidase family